MYGLIPLRKSIPVIKEFDNMFEDFFGKRAPAFGGFRLDVAENDKDFAIEAELPGINKEDIEITADDGYLTISVERKESKDSGEEKKSYIYKERRTCSLKRSVYLDGMADEGITAKYADGILTVNVPKKDADKKKTPIVVD